MPQISSIKAGNAVIYNGQIFTVVKMTFVNPGKGSAFYTTKLKNIKTGNVMEINIKSGTSLDLANVMYYDAQYLYADGGSYHFMDNKTYHQFSFTKEQLGDQVNYLQEEKEYKVMYIDDNPVSLQLPPKVELKVTHATPGVKGDTASSATKEVTVETGLTLRVPLFIKQGETIRINTDTGQYTERVNN